MAEQTNPHPKRRKKHRKAKRIVGGIFKAIGTLLLVGIITCSFLACFAAVYIQQVIIPQVHFEWADYPMNLSSIIYYTDPETGEVLEYETLSGDQDRVWVEYKALPKNLINAAVAIEDRRFYEHNGVDWLSTAKGVFNFFTGGKIRGGSTITQQMIKNSTQRDEVTVKRKIIEIFTALDVDKKYDKKQILEMYLNLIYFGRKCYGVYTASYKYFGKDLSELSLAECASLISITNNPSLYDPYTHPENNAERRGYVLDGMVRDGCITQEECDAAKAEVIDFHSGNSSNQDNTFYTWYTEQVITDVTRALMEKYGYSEEIAKQVVYSGGLKIHACVDVSVQAAVDEVYSNVENLPYTSPSGQQLQSAITIIDDKGNVVALAGKLGEKTVDDTRGYNMATRAQRQPGSSIKPISVYAPALEMGLITPYSVYEDGPDRLLNENPWPSNQNRRYQGQMTVAAAVANSTNTVAVRILEEVTPAVSYEYLVEKFGVDENHLVWKKTINGKEFSDLGASQLGLGGLTNGVTTLDMATAYSVFPRNGIYIQPRTFSKVEDANGKVILSMEREGEAVLKESTVYYINSLLHGVMTGGGTGRAYSFSGMTLAGKTGTTTADNDRWFVGYSPYYTAAVWVGYSKPETVKVSGGNPAGKMWNLVMSQIHEGLPDKGFPQADGLVSVEYCLDTGLLANDACRGDIRGNRTAVGKFFPEDVPMDYCEAHVMVSVCTADPILDEDGETVHYHMAGEFCPDTMLDEEGNDTLGRIDVAVLDMERATAGEDVVLEDALYFLKTLEELGPCTVHTEAIIIPPEPYDPSTFDIEFPETWPTPEQDPNFNHLDPATWPTPTLPIIPTPDPEATPSVGEWNPPIPSVDDTPPPVTETPEPAESAGPVQTPEPSPTPTEEAPVPPGG